MGFDRLCTPRMQAADGCESWEQRHGLRRPTRRLRGSGVTHLGLEAGESVLKHHRPVRAQAGMRVDRRQGTEA